MVVACWEEVEEEIMVVGGQVSSEGDEMDGGMGGESGWEIAMVIVEEVNDSGGMDIRGCGWRCDSGGQWGNR